MKKRIFAVLLSLAMLMSMTPASVFAAAPETAAPAEPETVEPEAVKPEDPAAPLADTTQPENPGVVVGSGDCGSNVKWTLYSSGLLYISGQGEMRDYDIFSQFPSWSSKKGQIKTVTIGDGVTDIGRYAFYKCSSLGSIEIPASVTSIEGGAFFGCSSLERVEFGDGSQLQSIGVQAFYDCSSLGSIEIPASVTSIGNRAFEYCSSLTAIHVDSGNAYYSSDDFGALFNKAQTKLLKAPDALSGVYTIPASVNSIGDWAFEYCSSLVSIEIPSSVTSIGSYAFSGCSSLESIQIPASVTSMGDEAFRYCSSLERVEFGDGSQLESIGWYAFSSCSCLVTIEIPASVTSIESSAFSGCSSLERVEFGDGSQLKNIGQHAFSDCSSLERVEFGDSSKLESIGYSAFSYCSSLGSIEIPSGVSSIGEAAFCGCSSLWKIRFLGNLPTVGNLAFSDVSAIAVYPEGNTTYQNVSSKLGDGTLQWHSDKLLPNGVLEEGECGTGVHWTLTADGLLMITGTGEMTSNPWYDYKNAILHCVIMPGVTNIVYSAFKDCGRLQSINIPASVTSIGSSAFSSCSSLERVEFGDSSKLESIGYSAFSYCSSLGSIEIPASVTSIGSGAFEYCSSLGSIEIPSGVTSIEGFTFHDCSSLGSIEIPASVTSIGQWAFYSCSSLERVEFGDSSKLESIGYSAFSSCSSLERVEFGDGSQLQSIGEYAFYNCSSLGSIEIPSGVTSIERYTFSNCSSLKTVRFLGKPQSIGSSAFSGVTATVYYRYAPGWESLADKNYGGKLTWVPDYGKPVELVYTGEPVYLEIGKSCDPATLSLKQIYETGYEEIITGKEGVTVDSLDTNILGKKTLTVHYGELSTEVTVYVHDTEQAVLSDLPESDHPYKSNVNETKTVTSEGALRLELTFSTNSCLGEGDTLRVTDKTGAVQAQYTGTELAGQTVSVPGDTANLWLLGTGSGGGAYGYKVESAVGVKTHHEYEEETTPATCTQDGKKVYTCSVCGDSYEETLPKLNHKWSEEWQYDETHHWHNCENDNCPVENDSEKDGYEEHQWNDWVIDQPATCTESGSKHRQCQTCHYEEKETIEALNHNWSDEWQNNEEYHWHNCENPNCPVKNDSEKDGYAQHNWGDWITEKEATCTEDGSQYRQCETCQYKETQTITKLNHNWSEEWQNNEEYHWHNCENPNCPVENDSEKGSYGPHDWGDWVIDQPATCTENGSKHRQCKICHYEEKETIEALNHNWSSTWEHDDDYHWHNCENPGCPETENENKGSYGAHQWTEWTRDVEPTCAQPGSEHRSCTTCGYREDREVIETVHKWSSAWEHDDDYHWHNCENPGCPVENDSDKNSYGEHQWTDWEQETAPSAEADGVEYRECETCGYRQERAVHYVDTESTEWDYVEGGELSLHIDAPMEDFAGVLMDGQPVEEGNYTVTEGSTVVTFHEDYLKTLDDGEHTVTVNFDDGSYAEVTLTIHATILGDADGDGELTASDLARMRRYIAGLEDGLRLEVLDLDGDGDVTATDLVKLSRRIAGLE